MSKHTEVHGANMCVCVRRESVKDHKHAREPVRRETNAFIGVCRRRGSGTGIGTGTDRATASPRERGKFKTKSNESHVAAQRKIATNTAQR